MLRSLLLALVVIFGLMPGAIAAQTLQDILQTHADQVAKPSRKKVGPLLDDLAASGLPQAIDFLEAWAAREVVRRAADGLFFRAADGALFDLDTGDEAGDVDGVKAVRPNGGVRRAVSEVLVQFQLLSPEIARRQAAVDAIARSPAADQIAPLAASIDGEPDLALKTRKEQLAQILTARFGETPEARVDAINTLSESISIETRAVLNQILITRTVLLKDAPDDANIAKDYRPFANDYPIDTAKPLLLAAGLLQPDTTPLDVRERLAANILDGAVAGIPVGQLNTDEARREAYDKLAENGLVPEFVPVFDSADISRHGSEFALVVVYEEPNSAVTDAAKDALEAIEARVGFNQFIDLSLDALSLASIYFLAAIGLAITFGVMGVINMAHGEFIMMGAYTGYVVQLFVPDYTLSILIALPLAFAITFGAGVAMERLVIRWLYHRPLETLLATFGISIALQQLAKNIFGTQARPLTSPAWLDGTLVINDVVAISYIRIAIFILALIFLALILFVLNRTRLGLEVRAVTQNPGMAASMGINPDRINMLTFGLGSGIAGIAGVAIGLYAKVTSEMGADYIVQSFMTVVVGGVGNVWGTLAGASLIGFLQKGIEWLNPSNTLAAQTYMILFIILFIQFRPKGIVALKGRAAGD
ncbi:MAG: urea ABC transporter permease subunit UrtB [Marinovum sp.]|nr:urea ABC transporter permease subunit UrtB [Marinovum sp.]